MDVKVHPNKWEVRFQNEPAVREAVENLVLEALQKDTPLSTAPALFDEPEPPVSSAVITRSSPEQYKKAEQQDNKPDYKENIPSPVFGRHESIINSPVSSSAVPLVARSDDGIGDIKHEISPEAYTKNAFSSSAVQEAIPEPAIPPASVPIEEPQIEQVQVPALQKEFETLPVRLIGVVFNTYILLECQDRLLLCDQHAVHERLLYEQFMRDLAGSTATQMLMVPEIVRLTHREYDMFLDAKDALFAAGFDVSDFGDLTVQLRSVPMMLGQARSAECFRDALDELIESGAISQQKRTDRIIQMACKHAVKGGERAPMEALMDLIRRMIRENVTPTCPHGRPLVIQVTERELEKRFHRIQN